MYKVASLRAHLTAAVSELARDPDKLAVFVKAGKMVAFGGGSLGFEYRYTAELVLLDFAASADAIMVPLLAWVYQHQIEPLDNPDLREKAIRFEAEILTKDTADVTLEIDLTERVLVTAGPQPASPEAAKRYAVSHPAEPLRQDLRPIAERWEAYMGESETPLAVWDFPANLP